MDLTVQNVYGLLIRSKLLGLDECREMFARWNNEAKENAQNLALFAKWVVANRYLTDYQASLLARGHAEGFYLNGYKILDRLGKGRMAGVYKAQHETGPVVAIKVLPPSKAKDRALLARFQREARVAVKLKHPNIVRTFQVGGTQQGDSRERLYYLVMEFLEGETLDDVIQRRKQFLPGEAVRIIYQALLGLQHLHEQGLVHRDIKPSNLMLAYPPGAPQQNDTLRATVKILDMGLARTLSDEVIPDPDRKDQMHLTSEGIVLGTPDYMAPEQARDARHADIRADIYSLGCVLYHLLDGKPPFPDTNIISQMIRHATEQPKPLKASNPAVPDGLQQIINWMLAKDPAQRYPTPERAAQAMQMFLAAGAESLTPEADPKMKKYLTYLEIDTAESEKKAKETPAATANPAGGTATQGKTKGTEKHRTADPQRKAAAMSKRERKRARKSAAALNLPSDRAKSPPAAKPVATAVPAGFDVELVAAPGSAAEAVPAGKTLSLPLTRRDLAMFLFGVGTVVIGVLITVGIMASLGMFSKQESNPEDGEG
jgi:serine/threonine protein kinase